MRIVAALGGNALLERGERPDAGIQETHVRQAAAALAPLAREHSLVVTHGNGPQVGLLATESGQDPALSRPYPFDVLVAQTQGMIGYWLVQALGQAIPGTQAACLLSRTLVRADDPAFARPSKFVGPVYGEAQARELAGRLGWDIGQDGQDWRRVVPSPEPAELLDLPLIQLLLRHGVIPVCSGGGGIPVIRGPSGDLRGAEAVVDKDLSAALLAEAVGAGALLLLTDVDAVYDRYGTPAAHPIRTATVAQLRERPFPAGSMGPKIEAACRFAAATGKPALIGRLADAQRLLSGQAGTRITG